MGKSVGQPSLLDFIVPEIPEALGVTHPVDPGEEGPEGAEVLLLGYGKGEKARELRQKGNVLLILCDREEEAIRARKEGFRAVLSHAEYLEDRGRFDWIATAECGYRIHDPQRAFPALAASLSSEGGCKLEFPVAGHRPFGEEILAAAAETLGIAEKVERNLWPKEEICRRALESFGRGDPVVEIRYRYLRIGKGTLEEWVEGLLGGRALLLEPSEREKLYDEIRRRCQREMEGGEEPVEEELCLRITVAAGYTAE
jgi:SAM-dependent methyltransferase